MKEDLISIIIPVYNVEPFLERCIESITRQTYYNLEIILVNDGSTDNSKWICEKWQKKDVRIKLINKKNGGLSDARNCGLNIAHGEYITFVDSDDWVLPTYIEELYSSCIEFSADIVICGGNWVDNNGIIQNDGIYQFNDLISFTGKEILEKLVKTTFIEFEKNSTLLCVAWNKLYKRELFKNLRYKVGFKHEDEIIIHRLFANSNKVVVIKSALYMYVQRSDSIMGEERKQKRDFCSAEMLYAYADRAKCLYENDFSDLSEKLYNYVYNMSLWISFNKIEEITKKEFIIYIKALKISQEGLNKPCWKKMKIIQKFPGLYYYLKINLVPALLKGSIEKKC